MEPLINSTTNLSNETIAIGMDIGGTLAKICICMPKKIQQQLKFHHLEQLKIEVSPDKEMYFIRFSTEGIEELLEFIKKFDLHQISSKFYVTGGGAYKFSELFQVNFSLAFFFICFFFICFFSFVFFICFFFLLHFLFSSVFFPFVFFFSLKII